MSVGSVNDLLFIVVRLWVNVLPVDDPVVHSVTIAIVVNPEVTIQIVLGALPPRFERSLLCCDIW